jgi:methionyl-tRNA formyltransferase
MEIPLVVTVADDPNETQWFGSVAATAADYGLAAITPAEANTPQVERQIASAKPDFIFSFYYRSMLGAGILNTAARGALNMHGSLLPQYRGRAPVNWAILNGERETGATLHYMVSRADAGDIVDQLAVPILQDDDAREVFSKVTVAAETVLSRSLPGLIAGTAPRRSQPVEPGQYFGRRRAEDGRIDWSWPARQIHNLVRAVAPPFPGAFAAVGGERWWIHKTRVESPGAALPGAVVSPGHPTLFGSDGRIYILCGDGQRLQLLAAANSAGPVDLRGLAATLQAKPVVLA